MPEEKIKRLSPLKSIKLKCKEDCCNNDRESWINCEITDCVLWVYRMGKNPNSKRKGNPDNLRAFRAKQALTTNNDTKEQDTSK